MTPQEDRPVCQAAARIPSAPLPPLLLSGSPKLRFDPRKWERGLGGEGITEEMAAAIAAIACYVESENARQPRVVVTARWLRAGRLEAHGLPLTAGNLKRGWGS